MYIVLIACPTQWSRKVKNIGGADKENLNCSFLDCYTNIKVKTENDLKFIIGM